MADNQPQMSDGQRNMLHRRLILDQGVDVINKIATLTQAAAGYTAGQGLVLNIPLQNVGLIKRLIIKITANVQQSAAETHTRTTIGPANFLSQIQLTDLNNLTRVNTNGWHLSMLASARRKQAFGAADTTDSPMGFGSNYNVITAPATVTAAANLFMMYEVPLAYSDNDLRGAIFANVVNATMNLQMTINPNLSVANTGNPSQACYQSSTAALMKINTYTIDVYQQYIDQLPKNQNGQYLLPQIDLQTQYNLLNIVNSGLVVGGDFSLPYANFRQYLSTFLMYDNFGVLNAGTDINYFSLQTANSMNILKYDPFISQLLSGRNKIADDWPKGIYYFDHRANPLVTLNYGNMQLNVNPSAVTAGAQIIAGYEYFVMQHQILKAGSMQNN